eukprot:TRINITY_DN6931_c0_g1_i1.p1 TRINITY_DN6931_c0_g1~~TRINITY_DN6931_c0_g1_i1.p1  ORF type:complete len:319 (-),score=119.22 TRINITY_DN6931_c0_g1_i1:32-850(-)
MREKYNASKKADQQNLQYAQDQKTFMEKKIKQAKGEMVEEEEEVVEEVIRLPAIVKGDSIGASEAMAEGLLQLPRDEVQIQVIKNEVGEVTESDVDYAFGLNAMIAFFGNKTSKVNAKQKPVFIVQERIIYDALEKVKDHMGSLLPPRIQTEITGLATVQQIFNINIQKGTANIAGCTVLNGAIRKGSLVRLIRNGDMIKQSKVSTLRHFKDDVTEVKSGNDCGIGLDYEELEVGDQIETYQITRIPRKLGDPKESVVTNYTEGKRDKRERR